MVMYFLICNILESSPISLLSALEVKKAEIFIYNMTTCRHSHQKNLPSDDIVSKTFAKLEIS